MNIYRNKVTAPDGLVTNFVISNFTDGFHKFVDIVKILREKKLYLFVKKMPS